MTEADGKQEIPVVQGRPLSPEENRLVAVYETLKTNQLDFLDAAGKRMIELSTGLLGLLLAAAAFGPDFPPDYLANNRALIIIAALVLFFLVGALLAGVLTVQPRRYSIPPDLGRMREALEAIRSTKAFWMRVATWSYFLGAAGLALMTAMVLISAR